MTKGLLEIVLLCALPASGKSEARKFLDSHTPEECREHFHLGKTVQLDDYPYVDLMRKIDEALTELGEEGVFFLGGDNGFKEPFDWGALIALVNEDYKDLVARRTELPKESAGEWMINRLDDARRAVTGKSAFGHLKPEIRQKVASAIENAASVWLKKKIDWIPDTLEGKTIVIEFARGGAHGSKFPLAEPYGYEYSLKQFLPEILEKASMLYIWVTPEQSRQKNIDRGHSDDPSKREISHSVPHKVMMDSYGCDDINYLLEKASAPSTVEVEAHGRKYVIPVGRFDNHVEDLTSFARADVADWDPKDVAKIREKMNEAFSGLTAQYLKLHP